jgi:hypothetical protein
MMEDGNIGGREIGYGYFKALKYSSDCNKELIKATN